ncbi:MAG: hypothetical protein EP340_10990 [Alphaproteobacteria bacterium]|nr:MAG: hypothetical protein EP340_10990 [Alphaproteobacteria bacterium]
MHLGVKFMAVALGFAAFMTSTSAMADDAFSWQVSGRLIGDAAWIEDSDNTFDVASSEIRYARIGVKGKIFSDLGYKLDLDFAGNTVTVKDAYISYAVADSWKLKFGQSGVFNTMEGLTSGRFTSLMSRAAFIEAFGAVRNVGVSLETGDQDWTLSFGIYRGTADEGLEDAGHLLATRATWSPSRGEHRMHLGGYVVSRQAGSGVDFRYRARPFFHLSPVRLVSTGAVGTEDIFAGVEAAWVEGPFWIAGEYGLDKVTSVVAGSDPSFDGGYIEAGYFLTGETRAYSTSRAVWDRPKVDRPLGQGPGAWAIVARYDTLDLTDKGWAGGTQDTIAAGLNWFPTSHTRLTINYSRSEIEEGFSVVANGPDGKNKVTGIGLRAQIDF